MTNTTYTFSQETINAMTELGATNKKCAICNHGNGYIIRGVVTYADGHKERIVANGKTPKTTEESFLRRIIKCTVPSNMFCETCEKYGIKPEVRGGNFRKKVDEAANSIDVQFEAKTNVAVEAKTEIQVEAKTGAVVEKQATAAIVTEIPRLETVRQSRSSKKLKAQKVSDGVAEIVPVEEQLTMELNASAITIPIAIGKAQKKLYELVMSNTFVIGNKKYAFIPKELLFGDGRFQRLNKRGSNKVKALIEKWNKNKCDALRVSPHNEEYRFSIIDGFHRYLAAEALGIEGLVCEILDMSTDPAERLKEEAFLFATQNDELDKLSPMEKHDSYIIIGSNKHIILDKMLKKYGIPLKTNSRGGKIKSGHLAAYSVALDIAKVYGEDMLDNVFEVICESRWNLARHGMCGEVFSSLRTVLALHPDKRTEIVTEAIDFMKPMSPENFLAESTAKYPKRTRDERCALYLEDYLCDKIGMERVYLANKEIERCSTINADVPVGVSAS